MHSSHLIVIYYCLIVHYNIWIYTLTIIVIYNWPLGAESSRFTAHASDGFVAISVKGSHANGMYIMMLGITDNQGDSDQVPLIIAVGAPWYDSNSCLCSIYENSPIGTEATCQKPFNLLPGANFSIGGELHIIDTLILM